MQAENRGFADVLTMTFPTDRRFEAVRARAYDGFVALADRAKAAGAAPLPDPPTPRQVYRALLRLQPRGRDGARPSG